MLGENHSPAAVEPSVHIEERDGFRVITSNGIPDHSIGRFLNLNNPHAVSAQAHTYRVTLLPHRVPRPIPCGLNVFGVAVNGIRSIQVRPSGISETDGQVGNTKRLVVNSTLGSITTMRMCNQAEHIIITACRVACSMASRRGRMG